MRWSPLARKECRSIATSRGVWLLALLLVPWAYRPSYVGWDALGPNITVAYVQVAAELLLPLGVLLLSYQSIVGERTSGSIKFVLGLPLTRTDILLGKIVGRTAGIYGPVCLSFLALAVIGLLSYGVFNPLLFTGQVVLTGVLVLALVTVATSVSALASRTVTAVAIVFVGVYLLLTHLWTTIAESLFTAITGTPVNPYSPPASGLLFLLVRLSPNGAYHVASNWLLGVGNSAANYANVLTKLKPATNTNILVVDATFPPHQIPWYLQQVVGLGILLAWIVIPLAVARYRFSRGDLA